MRIQEELHEHTNELIARFLSKLNEQGDGKPMSDEDVCWFSDRLKYIVYRAFTDGRAKYKMEGKRPIGGEAQDYRGLTDLTREEGIIIRITTPKPPEHIALMTKVPETVEALATPTQAPTKRAKKKAKK